MITTLGREGVRQGEKEGERGERKRKGKGNGEKRKKYWLMTRRKYSHVQHRLGTFSQ